MSAGKHLSCLFLSLYVSTVVADIGVWGNIIMINDMGREDQPSLTGFRVSNNSPYAVEFLGANGGGVQFNTIEENFNTPEGSEYTFTNRFLALEDDTPEAQAFFRICPHGYSRCLYFKLVSLRRDYGFYGYTGNKAADEHQKDFKGYVQSLTTVSPVEAALTSHGVSFVTIMGELYNLQRIASYQKMVNSLQAELGTATKNLLNASNKANLTSQDIQQLNSDISVAQNNIKEMKSEINEMKNFRKKYGSAENKTALFKDGKENFQHYHNNMKSTEKMVTNLKKEEFKLTTKHESRANKLNTAKQNYDHLRNKIQSAQANIKKTGVGRAVNSKFWTTFTMVVIPVIATYVGLLRSTRGSHQGLWETAFMAYSLEKITQDDVNMYSFIPEEALQTDFDFIDGNTASETIRLSFDGDDIDNQPIVEMSLSVLSNVWNRALIRKDKEGDWGEDKFRGVLKEEARWGVPEVEWKQSGALLLSIKSFNDLDYITQYVDMTTAIKEHNPESQASSLMIFDAPELYRGDADLSKINLEQDLRVLEASSNDDQDTKTLPLEALSIKNGEYGKIYINPDLKDNGVDYNSTKLYAELIEDDSDYEITLPITRNRQTFEQWKSEEGFVGVYLDTDCTSIKDDEACPLNIAITGIDHPLVGALLVAENSSMQMRISVFINTDISPERPINYYEKQFKPGVSIDDYFDPFILDDSYYDYYEQKPFYIGVKNMSHQEVDDVSLLFPEEGRNKGKLQHLRVIGSDEIDQVMSEFSKYFKDMGIQKSDVCLDGVIPPGGCKFIIMGGDTVPLGAYEFDFMIDGKKFKSLSLMVR